MSAIGIDLDRRHLLARVWRRSILELLADVARPSMSQTRQQIWTAALENELRAFGPELSAECAHRAGVAPDGDYAAVAAAIAVALPSEPDPANSDLDQ